MKACLFVAHILNIHRCALATSANKCSFLATTASYTLKNVLAQCQPQIVDIKLLFRM